MCSAVRCTNKYNRNKQTNLQLEACASTNFKKVRDGEVDLKCNEKVTVLDVKNGFANVQKSDGTVGKCPNYYLKPDEIPGNTFADQIQYRRDWYNRIDERHENGMNNMMSRSDKYPIDLSQSTSDHFDVLLELSKCERPVVVEGLKDVEATEGQMIEMSPVISSNTDYTVTWRGPAIESKRAKIQTNELNSRIIINSVEGCDTGAYSVIARNEYGVTSSVAFLNVVPTPDPPSDFTCKITGNHEVRLKWKQEVGLKYCIEYKYNDPTSTSIQSFQIATTNVEKAHVALRNFANDSYTFRVFAYNQRVRSDPSQSITVVFDRN